MSTCSPPDGIGARTRDLPARRIEERTPSAVWTPHRPLRHRRPANPDVAHVLGIGPSKDIQRYPRYHDAVAGLR